MAASLGRKELKRLAALLRKRLRAGGYKGRLDRGNPIYLLNRMRQEITKVTENLQELTKARMAYSLIQKVGGQKAKHGRVAARKRCKEIRREVQEELGDVGIFVMMVLERVIGDTEK